MARRGRWLLDVVGELVTQHLALRGATRVDEVVRGFFFEGQARAHAQQLTEDLSLIHI